MQTVNRDELLRAAGPALIAMLDAVEGAKPLRLSELAPGRTALVMVDVINGFVREGPLSSPRVEDIIPVIAKLSESCTKLGIPKVAFADSHGPHSPEFFSFPVHCLTGTSESEVVEEIRAVGGYTLIGKNSTNGFLEDGFRKWLEEHPQTDTFVVTGDCTDICVLQFCLTLKTWFNRIGRESRVIVPLSAVETYDMGPAHDGALSNLCALHLMAGAGVELVKDIIC